MTALELDRLSAAPSVEQRRGWVVSALLHLAAGTGVLFFMMEVDKPVLQEAFRWDISMVESPMPAETQPVEPVVQPPPPPVKPSPPVPQRQQVIAQQPQPQVQHEATVAVEATQVVQDVVTNAEAVESVDQPIVEQALPVVSATPVFEHRAVQYRQVRYRETRADYGWLRDTLWRRIEELKRYPAQARMNHWEGKVVVAAVIRDDGEVMGVRIAETSGQAVLDEEAIAVMKRASPLALKHPLGQRQITILIPINYRLAL
mgnify:CR=1 FL=1